MRCIMAKKSRNITLIKSIDELKDEVNFEDFEYKEYFSHLCNLIPNDEKERLEIEVIDKESMKKKGAVYIFVIEGKIFKIGQTIDTLKKRIGSYNCGKLEYRAKGTCSTTNFFVLQSLLRINKKVEVYTYYPDAPRYNLFGKEYHDTWPVSKKAENIIIKDFLKNHDKKPIGCTQS